jgi:hypothetical protein
VSEAEGGISEDEHRRVATEMYERWQVGEKKSRLEIEYWDDATSHGKRFTSYTKHWLGVKTETKSSQTQHIERLEGLLRANGISPTDAGDLDEHHRILAKARESALSAVRGYNDPLAGFRTEAFVVLMVIAWNSLFQAILERDGIDYWVRDAKGAQVKIDGRPKVEETRGLARLAIGGADYEAVRQNMDFFLRLRHLVVHRYLPALDSAITGEAQAMLLNFETLLIKEFGEVAALGERLTVPLQLSGFRSEAGLRSLKLAQAQLPTDVMDFLCRHREEVPDEVLRSPEYALQIFFVPVTASRERSAEAVVRFLKPSDVTPELEEQLQQLAVVDKPKRVAVASGDLLLPGEVVPLVAERLPFRFTMDTHTRCWRHYGVRPVEGSGEPEATDGRYCRFDRLHNGYGYTQAWVDKLVNDLSDAAMYERVVGVAPDQR